MSKLPDIAAIDSRRLDAAQWMAMWMGVRCDITGKVTYAFKDVAKQAALRMQAQGHNIQAYHCRSCDWWHTGHVPNAPRMLSEEARRAAANAISYDGSRWYHRRRERFRRKCSRYAQY